MEHSQVIFNEIVALFDIFFLLDQNLMTNLQWIYLFSTSNWKQFEGHNHSSTQHFDDICKNFVG